MNNESRSAASSARYRRLAGLFTETVDAVPDSGWEAPSPCDGWSASDVLDHVVTTQREFLERFDLPVGGSSTGDRRTAWPIVRDAMQAALDDPATADMGFDGFFGPTTFGETVDGFYSFDLLVHRWDIARATGLTGHEAMPDDEVGRTFAAMEPMGEQLRQPGICGPAIELADDAPEQDRFLAFLGRRP